ncbi:NADP-specific glutamate dehydrogenase [uncultured Halopseudomonas sp.]|uniref:NADP-specific glutamate dehydrogenase n=1 Tax=uncultured Halopseudomonas sp. TaxID=2901193 RepID=UPI0030EF89B0|tara:strand:- start:20268 stop:21605 length:1338 start_codon:yes stop_codon:yes gene_type:complete
MTQTLSDYIQKLQERDSDQPEFHQAVKEILTSLWPMLESKPEYFDKGIIDRLVEPERTIIFRVPWVDDKGKVQVNRGYRVQMNSAIGPYKGGLRFHPSVDLGVLKFLAFEQVFKNALTMLPLGGAKGGADFNPKDRSDGEIMRFCQSFMTELSRHIGEDLDVPAGDIGVGPREIGYLYGQHRRLTNRNTSALTGKGQAYGGSRLRTEATGYGVVYFTQEMLNTRDCSIEGQRIAVSGAGNVAQHTVRKLLQLGGIVVSMSDSTGTLHNPEGLTTDQWEAVVELKNRKGGSLRELDQHDGLRFLEEQKPWQLECDIAIPCATQNELDADDARALLDNGCWCVTEGANMPSTIEAIQTFQQARILFGPGKAANAGGVAVSGLEMSQNAMRLHWGASEIDDRLLEIMKSIHQSCVQGGKEDDHINYVKGANLAGFTRVAEAMLAQGVI